MARDDPLVFPCHMSRPANAGKMQVRLLNAREQMCARSKRSTAAFN
jgi:hypothetical protein